MRAVVQRVKHGSVEIEGRNVAEIGLGMIILLGIVGGMAGSAGLIILLDAIDDSIKNVDMVKSLGIPVLAIIPHIQDSHALIKARRKDICLYTLSGLYLVILAAVIVLEQVGLLGKIFKE